jgi:hypothetical protein
MGDKSPQNQIKIGNLTVKLDPNNQQKNRRESNYERNYYRSNDRNYGSNDRYNDRHNDRDRDRDRDRERNKYQNDSKNYNNKKNYDDNRYLNKRKDYDYDDRREKYKNYKNKSHSNSVSGSKQRHSHNRNHHSRSRSRSRSRTHSHHNYPNRNKNYNEQGNKNNQNDKKNSSNKNNNVNDSQSKNNNTDNNSLNNNMINNNNLNNNNMGYINPNFMNYNEFFKKFYQMNQLKNNSQNANIIVPIGIPVNYFFNPNLNNMNNNNQMNKINNANNQINNNNNNNYIQNNNHTQNQNNNQNQAQKEEPSNTILITDLDTNITKDTLEDIFREKCLKLQISMPIDIRLLEALNIAYIIFPSVTSCVTVYNSLVNQKILINGKYFPIQFSPNLTQKYSNNRDTLTYVTQISSNTSLTTSMETTVHEDWYCVYCDSKNFSRRTVCFKCQKPKSINCRVVPVIKQKKIILGANGEILPNNSIIIQGKQVQYSNEGEVFIFLLI